MNIPGSTAERSLHAVRGRYRSGRPVASRSSRVIPAIPRCENCDALLEVLRNARRTTARRLHQRADVIRPMKIPAASARTIPFSIGGCDL